MPVTTPSANEISISLPQNGVMRVVDRSSPVRYCGVWQTATKTASPIVTGTKRKW